MRSLFLRVLAVAILFLVLSGSVTLKAQSAPQSASSLADRCIRWLKASVPDPDQDKLDAASFCLGYRTGNVDGLWSDCKAPEKSGRPPGHCGFEGRVMPADTLAISVITPSHDGHELLDDDAQSGFDQHGVIATLYSRTDLMIDGTLLPGGLYRISPHKAGESWELNLARLQGEWNDPVGSNQFIFHARMNSNEEVRSTDTLFYQMWLLPKHCGSPSRVSSLREFEFSFGETDVSLCVSVIQSPPAARDELSKR